MGKKKPVKVKSSAKSTRSAMEDLDRIFHEKARLGILTTIIASSTPLNFNELKALCGLTDGNLNRHLKVLVDSKILAVEKSGRGRNTNSAYRLTAGGSEAVSAVPWCSGDDPPAGAVDVPCPAPSRSRWFSSINGLVLWHSKQLRCGLQSVARGFHTVDHVLRPVAMNAIRLLEGQKTTLPDAQGPLPLDPSSPHKRYFYCHLWCFKQQNFTRFSERWSNI